MNLHSEVLARLVTLDTDAGLAELDAAGLSTVENAKELALHALDTAEANSTNAYQILSLASALSQSLGSPPALRGQIDYAQARIYLQNGHLSLAETALRSAQSAWREAEDSASVTRSRLGLTQILTLQGRYAEAEQSCRLTISELQSRTENQPPQSVAANLVSLMVAYNNLSAQLLYQERYADAIAEADSALTQIEVLLANATLDPSTGQQLRYWQGYLLINKATALMSLDQPVAAESALRAASDPFQQVDDALMLGRVQANLGSLFARTGRYAEALRQFDIASQLLLGDGAPPDAADLARSELLLDQASNYLALNLLSEAGAALGRCEQLYRAASQPYELAQCLLFHGLVRCRLEDFAGAQALLIEAERLFAGLDNRLWQNRVALALATLEAQSQNIESAVNRLDALLAQATNPKAASHAPDGWDIISWTEARLLRLRLHLLGNELDQARALAAQIERDLQIFSLPQLALWLQHAFGQIEAASGNWGAARRYLEQAVNLLETQRSTLTIEEVRTSFLNDKSTIYADLVLALLAEPNSQGVEEAFSVIERARSRALLERLLTALSSVEEADESAQQARRSELQQQLHWLYNRLLSDPGSRRIDATIDDEIRRRESALQQLEWQQAPQLFDAQPVDLAALQSSLADDQQSLVFFIAGNEVMVFVIDRTQARLHRHLCSHTALQEAQREWRFQLGRAEMSPLYMNRHAARFEEAWRKALHSLYSLLIEPIITQLTHKRLLIIPYGSLHLLPFHALWNSSEFLLQRFEVSYAPSASMAVQSVSGKQGDCQFSSLAALAITDPAIPAARNEVESAALSFASSLIYIDEDATLAALQTAARSADVLHLATHGLFRPDNAFFSSLKLADGWVDVRQLYRLPLTARLVVLSACESGAGQVQGGDEVIGLARGFLGAGAETVVASLWNVHDASSARLMADFYHCFTENRSPATALRSAQLESVKRNQHPYYWASYFVIGR